MQKKLVLSSPFEKVNIFVIHNAEKYGKK